MKKYCVMETGLLEQHAGSKARCDVAQTLIKEGWMPAYVDPIKVRVNVNYFERIRVIPGFLRDWKRIAGSLQKGDSLLIQYPLDMYPKVAMLALKYIKKIKEKGVQVGILIHDIDSLRTGNPEDKKWYQEAEHCFFVLGDYIIAHNEKMLGYLRGTGLTQPIHSLELFDYLADGELSYQEEMENTVIIAGNLSPEKAGYVYSLPTGEIRYSLYGPNLEKEKAKGTISYKGSFQPDKLPEVLKGRFGLVWDGAFAETCGGEYGEYMRYNNPHKTSLYLACGIPVIVWEEAAAADFVRREGVGISVKSLSEIPKKTESITKEEYRKMKERAVALGNRLRNGDMLRAAMKKAGV